MRCCLEYSLDEVARVTTVVTIPIDSTGRSGVVEMVPTIHERVDNFLDARLARLDVTSGPVERPVGNQWHCELAAAPSLIMITDVGTFALAW